MDDGGGGGCRDELQAHSIIEMNVEQLLLNSNSTLRETAVLLFDLSLYPHLLWDPGECSIAEVSPQLNHHHRTNRSRLEMSPEKFSPDQRRKRIRSRESTSLTLNGI